MHIARFSAPSGLTVEGEWTEDGLWSGGKRYDPADVEILPPVEPTKVVCQAGGYVDHRKESGFDDVPARPEFFLKTPNCVVGHKDVIELPPGRDTVEFEAEFAIVIGTQCRAVTEDAAMEYLRGYTCE